MLLKVVKNTVLFSIIIGICVITFSCGNRLKSETGNSKQDDVAIKDSSTENNEILKQVQNNKSIPLRSLSEVEVKKEIIVGANRTQLYLPLLKGKRVGIVANQTSVIFKDKKENREKILEKRY